MRKLIFVFVAFLFLGCKSTENQQAGEKFEVFRGTNLAHWLSQSDKRGTEREQFITKTDIETIAQMGFDHVRLPIDEEQMWNENGNRHNDAFQLMKNCIEWCDENNLRIIIDLHILRSHHFNAEKKPLWTDLVEQKRFYELWRDLADALQDYPNSLVAYELMNEPVSPTPEGWNQLVSNTVAILREMEPGRTIVIGSNRWQSVDTFNELKIPANDSNLLLSFHFYEPFLLTHWNASWTSLRGYEGPVHYPGVILTEEEFKQLPQEQQIKVENWVGREFNRDWILEKWQEAIKKAKELDLPLYCGEFGVIVGPPEQDRLAWYRDMITLFEETGIGYANWNYKSDNFGLINSEGIQNEALIHIVTGK